MGQILCVDVYYDRLRGMRQDIFPGVCWNPYRPGFDESRPLKAMDFSNPFVVSYEEQRYWEDADDQV